MDPNLAKFDHLVVVMFENRSFDNLLGYLYTDDVPSHFIPECSKHSPFNGVYGKSLSNPYDFNDTQGTIPVSPAPYASLTDMIQPFPDPGETYPHVFRQQYGKNIDCENPITLPDFGDMRGFADDFIEAMQTTDGWEDNKNPSLEEISVIMKCFPPEATPILSGLAKSFAVSDAWYCSIPSQTFGNRSFVHSACSHGFVNNSDYVKWLKNDQPTVFNLLSTHDCGWQVLWDKQDILGSLTRLLQPALFGKEFDDHFVSYDEGSIGQILSGDLPEYTFIEPRLFFNHNDMHPSVYLNLDVASSILAGELLLDNIYNGIRNNPNRDSILLVVMFDEHGGTYDHVWPSCPATPPEKNPTYPRECGFHFNRFGIRTPMIFISPYVQEKTVVRAPPPPPFDHTSIIRTICERWLPPGTYLTDRDQAAPSIAAVLDRTSPRTDLPVFCPREYCPISPPRGHKSFTSDFQRDVIGVVESYLDEHPPDRRHIVDALEFFDRIGKDLHNFFHQH